MTSVNRFIVQFLRMLFAVLALLSLAPQHAHAKVKIRAAEVFWIGNVSCAPLKGKFVPVIVKGKKITTLSDEIKSLKGKTDPKSKAKLAKLQKLNKKNSPICKLGPIVPTASNGSAATTENTPVAITLSAASSDNKPLTFQIGQQPAHGSLSGTAPNLVYTPNSHFIGSDAFTFFVLKDNISSNTAAVSISVSASTPEFSGNQDSLEHYRDRLTEREMYYLCKQFWGCNDAVIAIFKSQGLDAGVSALLSGTGVPSVIEQQALAVSNPKKDKFCPQNFTLNGHLYSGTYCSEDKIFYNTISEQTRMLHKMVYGDAVVMRMAEFWMDHFGISPNTYSGDWGRNSFIPAYYDTITENVWNFEDLISRVSATGAVMVELGTNANTSFTPNQNFGRELMELYTIGVQDPVTHERLFTEADVASATAASAGPTVTWHLVGDDRSGVMVYNPGNPTDPSVLYPLYVHIPTFDIENWFIDHGIYHNIKIFSGTSREGNAPFMMNSFSPNHSGDTFSAFLLSLHQTHRTIGAKLFSSFVHPEPSEAIVSEMAAILESNDYDIKSAMRRLLTSSAFFSQKARHSGLASPLNFFLTMIRTMKIPVKRDDVLIDVYQFLAYALRDSGLEIGRYPSVFGNLPEGTNRNGEISRGERWITSQYLLTREQSYVNFASLLTAYKATLNNFSWANILPTDPVERKDPVSVINSIALRMDVTLTDSEMQKLVAYLNRATVTTSANGASFNVGWANNISSTTFVDMKVSGLIGILASLPQYNM